MRATDMNEHSSRSHVILQLHVETERLDGPRKGQVALSKLNLVRSRPNRPAAVP